MKHKTVWVVWFFIVAFAALMPLQLWMDFELPLGAAAYALMLVVSGYTGIDQLAAYTKTKKLPAGKKYDGNKSKLTGIVIALCILSAESIILQSFLPKIELPLDQIVMATGVVSAIFAGGNKAVTTAEMSNGG